jgi:hypothetical protein
MTSHYIGRDRNEKDWPATICKFQHHNDRVCGTGYLEMHFVTAASYFLALTSHALSRYSLSVCPRHTHYVDKQLQVNQRLIYNFWLHQQLILWRRREAFGAIPAGCVRRRLPWYRGLLLLLGLLPELLLLLLRLLRLRLWLVLLLLRWWLLLWRCLLRCLCSRLLGRMGRILPPSRRLGWRGDGCLLWWGTGV